MGETLKDLKERRSYPWLSGRWYRAESKAEKRRLCSLCKITGMIFRHVLSC